jgi:hypothetical protein
MMPAKQPATQKPAKADEVQEQTGGRRGEATKLGGNKIHGDDLEGMIPTTPMTVESPARDGAEIDVEALE